MSTEKGTYQAPAGAAVPVKGEVIATQPASAPIAATVVAGTPWPVGCQFTVTRGLLEITPAWVVEDISVQD